MRRTRITALLALALPACGPGAAGPPVPRARPAATRPGPPPTARVPAPRPAGPPAARRITWWTSAMAHRATPGRALALYCPPRGQLGNLWGSGPYTDDSSICTAAVHAGRITRRAGGTVLIRVVPGLSAYPGSRRHGVTSRAYGPWTGSFEVIWGRAGWRPARRATGPHRLTWRTSAVAWRGKRGRLTFHCPAGGRPGGLWGTIRYTDDSSICTAGVHAGVIRLARGGRVTIRILPGAKRYLGNSQNGITSRAYGPWTGSFEVVGAQRMSRPQAGSAHRPQTIGWGTNAVRYRGQVGRRFLFRCPPARRLGSVWGTVVYTDDSSICTAALHAGRITRAGGVVAIEIAGGFPRYPGSLQHGVSSRAYGAWSGSFAFP